MRVLRQFSGKGLWNRVFRCAAYALILALCLPAPSVFAPVSASAASPNTADAQRPAAAPRTLSSILTEQAASFLGVPAPIQPGMDEGLGFHQDGTVRKAGGTGNAGPSDNGQRAAAYMRSGLNGYGPGFGMNNGQFGVGPGYDPFTGQYDPTRGGRRTNGQTRDFSNFDPLRMAQDRAMSWGNLPLFSSVQK